MVKILLHVTSPSFPSHKLFLQQVSGRMQMTSFFVVVVVNFHLCPLVVSMRISVAWKVEN